MKRASKIVAGGLAAVLLLVAAAWMTIPGRTKIADVYWEITLASGLTTPDTYVGPHQWAVAIHPDGTQLAVGGMYREVLLYDLATGERLPPPNVHAEWVMEVGWSADGRYFASTDFRGGVAIQDLQTGEEVGRFSGRDVAYTFAFHPTKPLMAWGAYDGSIRLVDLTTGGGPGAIPANEGGVLYVTFSPDGEQIISTGEDGKVRFFDLDSRRPAGLWNAHDAGITSISFSPDGSKAVTGGDDSMVRLWDFATGTMLHEHSPHGGWINFSTFLPDGRYVTVGTSNVVSVWDAETPGAPQQLDAGNWLMCARPLPDGSAFATSGKDGVIRLWDTSTLEVVREIDVFADIDPGGLRWPAL
ncbi:MAG: WD40 repeat domain-containing protein [Proteobacteria bacterium]|nr:WD40 repeat domain-containing protein [Pseudomonadota bacterium]